MRIMLAAVLCAASQSFLSADDRSAARPIEKGVVCFKPSNDQQDIPAQYRLDKHDFTYQMKYLRDLPDAGV